MVKVSAVPILALTLGVNPPVGKGFFRGEVVESPSGGKPWGQSGSIQAWGKLVLGMEGWSWRVGHG